MLPATMAESLSIVPRDILGRAGISWERFLPAIAWAESEHYAWAVSKKGARHGRGIYQVSEVCLQHYKDETPGTEWIEPRALFNSNICRTVAIWYLQKCNSAYDEIRPDHSRFNWVLSAYNQGIRGVQVDGINWRYVQRVLDGRRFMATN